jgi:hypothetical protein
VSRFARFFRHRRNIDLDRIEAISLGPMEKGFQWSITHFPF